MRPADTVQELLERARTLRGRPLGWIAERLGVAVPEDLRREKGWVGMLLETALGATGGPHARRDFPELGIELKTIPVDPRGRPRESTYVCTAPLDEQSLLPWDEAWVRAKLARVLWVPVLGDGPPGEREVGEAVLWSPSPAEEAVLRADYEELSGLLGLGRYDELDARHGEALQVRPKAADSRVASWVMNAEAEWVQVNPRGYYLRAEFTWRILTGGRAA